MDNNIVQHLKTQLNILKESTSLDYSKGIVNSLLAYIEVECPKDITIKIKDVKGNLISAIKAIRLSLDLGLAESKRLVDIRGIVYTGKDLNRALEIRQALDEHLVLEIDGPENFKLFFTKES